MATVSGLLNNPSSNKTTKEILADLKSYEADESAKFDLGEKSLKQMQDEYTLASEANHVALKDLYDSPNDGFKASQDYLFTTVLPQLKLLNELSTLVHAFPHYSIPSIRALTDDLKEKVNFTLNNIQNFGQVGSIVATDPELAAMVSTAQQKVPYKYVAGKTEDSESEEAVEEAEEPEEVAEVDDDGIIVEESSSSDEEKAEEKAAAKKKKEQVARPVKDSESKQKHKKRKRVKKQKPPKNHQVPSRSHRRPGDRGFTPGPL